MSSELLGRFWFYVVAKIRNVWFFFYENTLGVNDSVWDGFVDDLRWQTFCFKIFKLYFFVTAYFCAERTGSEFRSRRSI